MSDEIEVVGWLVEQGRVYQDRIFIGEASACRSCNDRQDRSIVSGLCRLSDAQRLLDERDAEITKLRARVAELEARQEKENG